MPPTTRVSTAQSPRCGQDVGVVSIAGSRPVFEKTSPSGVENSSARGFWVEVHQGCGMGASVSELETGLCPWRRIVSKDTRPRQTWLPVPLIRIRMSAR